MKDQISIDDIKTIRNIRTEIGDVSDLMSSIRENGLLHPIGVVKSNEEYILVYGHRRFSALKKLGRKALEIGKEVLLVEKDSDIDLIVLNIVENYQTKPNTPLEFGNACLSLKELGLSIGEISVRLSVPKNKILTAISLINDVPEEQKKNVSYLYGSEEKKGRLSATVSSALAYCKRRYKMGDRDTETLFEEARKRELSTKDIRIISLLMQEGMTLKKALSEKDLWINKQVDFILRKDVLEEIKEPFSIYSRNILKKQHKELFY
jgi:ParB family transcriptional regulator, chromosome partitioning protein